MLINTAVFALASCVNAAIANAFINTYTFPAGFTGTCTQAAIFRVHMRALVSTDVVINADLIT